MRIHTTLTRDQIRAIAAYVQVDVDHSGTRWNTRWMPRNKVNLHTALSIRPDRDTAVVLRGPRGGYKGTVYKWQANSRSCFRADKRIFAVCWHGHYAFLDALTLRDPKARITTTFYDARGRDEWLEAAEASANHQVGAPIYPISAADACNCDPDDPDLCGMPA